MQIIQALLGNQVNTLGQKSYLGNHHQLFPQSLPNLHYRHSNFITPLVTSKPLFTPSKLLLARKGQPFIDTLITDDDNLVGRDMDNDFPSMEWENYNSLLPENSSNQLTDITFNLGNISNLLQSKIATNVSNDILLEMAIQSKPKTTRKNTTQKSPKRKPSPSKTQPKKSAKSSKTKKVNQVVDETASYTSTAEENLLITDNYQSEIFNSTENYPTIQPQINLDKTIIDNSESQITSSNLEDNSTLQSQITDNEPEVITDLLSNLTDVVNESDIRKAAEISTQNGEFDSKISDSSEYSPMETQSSDIEEQINIVNNLTNHQAPIASETLQGFDILDIPVSTKSPQKKTEDSNITNDVSPAPIDIIPKENLLSTARNSTEIIDNSSDLLAANDQNVTNTNLGETKSLASEIITPKFENTANSFTHLDNTQKQPVVSDEFSHEITAESVSESNTLVTNKNTIDISQEINTDNLTRKSIDTPDIQLNNNLETNQIPAENPEATIPEIREIPAVTKSDIQSNNNLETNQIPAENPEATTSEIREIPAVTKSDIQLNTNLETNQIPAENPEATIPEIREIPAVTKSDIQLNTNLETNQIPAENPEATTSEIREIPAVTKSDIQLNTNLETNQIPAENPEATTSEIREIPAVTKSDIQLNTNLETNQIPAENPEATTSEIREIPAVTKSDIQLNTNLETNQIPAENPEATTSEIREIPAVTKSDIQLNTNLETNQIPAENPEATTSETREIPAVTTSDIQLNTNLETNQIPAENPEATTSEIREIPAVTKSDIQLNTNLETNQIPAENPEATTSETREIPAVTTSDIQLNTNLETNQIPAENPEATTSETREIPAVTTSPVSPKSDEVNTPNSTIITPITPENTDISPSNITDNLPIFRNILDNAPPTTSESSLAFESVDLSTFINNSDISESTSSQDNEDTSSSIDIETNTGLNNLPAPKGYATGGQVTTTAVENHQPVAPSDTVPAMLTPGEFVINAKDTQKNLQILKHINTGGSPEEIISPSLEVANTQIPEKTNFSEPTTKVDSFTNSPLQRKEAESNSSSKPTALTSPSLGEEIGKQRLSILNSPQINTVENTTNNTRESSPHYSSPSLIFRKSNSSTNTETPSQWSNIEELLNSNYDQSNNFNFNSVESNWQNSPSSQVSSSSTSSNVFTKRLSTPQGFANGGEVIAPDISRDIAPITETIESPYSSLPAEKNDDNEDDDAKLEILAQEIYYRLRQKIEIEKERQGKYIGRLPW